MGRAAARTGSDLHMKTFAAATLAFFVRVFEDEAAFKFFFDKIHLGTDEEHHRLRVDQHFHAFLLHHLIELAHLVGILDGIGQAGAAARADADLDPDGGFTAL